MNLKISLLLVVDTIPEDKILYFHPDEKKKLRTIDATEELNADLLLKKLLDDAQVGLLTYLDDKFHFYVEYLKSIFTPALFYTFLCVVIGIFIVEKALKYLFSK